MSLLGVNPVAPGGAKRSATFSPRVQFHPAWTSAEYDLAGGIATYNRLTPILAQQIRAELNSFKMVCLLLKGVVTRMLTQYIGHGSA